MIQGERHWGADPVPERSRVRLLVSVRDAAEAGMAAAAGADLVDAKDPARGALGALPAETVKQIVTAAQAARGTVLTSAVAGEPASAAEFTLALSAMVATGVDYLKVALSPEVLAEPETIRRSLAATGLPVIAVLFAEDGPNPSLVPMLGALSFAGAMIDTRTKAGTHLPDIVAPKQLSAFVDACRAQGMMSGLAGSLSLADIPGLARHGPDYLGFRGGLCAGSDRRGALDPGRITEAARLLAGATAREAA